MSGFLTALLLCVCAGVLFASTQRSSLLSDSPVATTVAEAQSQAQPAGPSTAMMR